MKMILKLGNPSLMVINLINHVMNAIHVVHGKLNGLNEALYCVPYVVSSKEKLYSCRPVTSKHSSFFLADDL